MGIVQFHLIAFLIMHAVALVAPALTLTLILHPTNLQKDGEPLPADRFSLSGGNLTITGLVESDRGMYECSATNEAATITAEAELMIENIAPGPRTISRPTARRPASPYAGSQVRNRGGKCTESGRKTSTEDGCSRLNSLLSFSLMESCE